MVRVLSGDGQILSPESFNCNSEKEKNPPQKRAGIASFRNSLETDSCFGQSCPPFLGLLNTVKTHALKNCSNFNQYFSILDKKNRISHMLFWHKNGTQQFPIRRYLSNLQTDVYQIRSSFLKSANAVWRDSKLNIF